MVVDIYKSLSPCSQTPVRLRRMEFTPIVAFADLLFDISCVPSIVRTCSHDEVISIASYELCQSPSQRDQLGHVGDSNESIWRCVAGVL